MHHKEDIEYLSWLILSEYNTVNIFPRRCDLSMDLYQLFERCINAEYKHWRV
jgi:hypothetical protein